jgi:peptidoglycan hydrolase-like protein with peptidoglycan-binding domain
MWKKVMATICAGMLALVIVQAQQKAASSSSKVMALTALDYIEIQQLTARYGYAIDKCTNSGYDYADLYTADGVFSVEDENGVPATARFEGRDRLAQADGGGKSGCIDPKTAPDRYSMSHIVANLVITPAPGGATGKSNLLVVGFGDPTAKEAAPVKAYSWGHYDDFYVKTAEGWRFKSRVHVWPGMPDSLRKH